MCPVTDVSVAGFLLGVAQKIRHIPFFHQVRGMLHNEAAILRVTFDMIVRMIGSTPSQAQHIHHFVQQGAERVRCDGILPSLSPKCSNQLDKIRNVVHKQKFSAKVRTQNDMGKDRK